MLSRSAFRHASQEKIPLRLRRDRASDIPCVSPTALWIPSSHVGCPPTSTMDSRFPSSFACDPLSARASLDRWLRQFLRTSLMTPSRVAHQKRRDFSTPAKRCAARISLTASRSLPSCWTFLALNFSVQSFLDELIPKAVSEPMYGSTPFTPMASAGPAAIHVKARRLSRVLGPAR